MGQFQLKLEGPGIPLRHRSRIARHLPDRISAVGRSIYNYGTALPDTRLRQPTTPLARNTRIVIQGHSARTDRPTFYRGYRRALGPGPQRSRQRVRRRPRGATHLTSRRTRPRTWRRRDAASHQFQPSNAPDSTIVPTMASSVSRSEEERIHVCGT